METALGLGIMNSGYTFNGYSWRKSNVESFGVEIKGRFDKVAP